MARPRKATKVTRTVKAKSAHTYIGVISDLEKRLTGVKKELATTASKAVNVAREQATGLKKQLFKAQAQKKQLKSKRVSAVNKAKLKPTKTTLTLVKKAKTDYNEGIKIVSKLQEEANGLKETANNLKSQQKKCAVLAKILVKFEKDWAKKLSQAKKGKARKTTAKKAVVQKTIAKKGITKKRTAKKGTAKMATAKRSSRRMAA